MFFNNLTSGFVKCLKLNLKMIDRELPYNFVVVSSIYGNLLPFKYTIFIVMECKDIIIK